MKTILIAIDDQVISDFLSQELFEDGISSRTVSDPSTIEGEIEKSAPDLLIIDDFFAGGRGYELCCELQKQFSDLQVLLWPSWTFLLSQKVEKLPANTYVTKTYSLRDLRREVSLRVGHLAGTASTNNACVPHSPFGMQEVHSPFVQLSWCEMT